MSDVLLSNDDLVLARIACELAIEWHKSKPPHVSSRETIPKLEQLLVKFRRAAWHLPGKSHRSQKVDDSWRYAPVYGPLPEAVDSWPVLR